MASVVGASCGGGSGGDGGALRVAVVTGSRAEFGLLRPVIERLRGDARFRCEVVCAGMHLSPGSQTWREVEGSVGIDARVPMQCGELGGGCGVRAARWADAAALGRGVSGFAGVYPSLFGGAGPDWVMVLGDRVEAFAAASAASVAGIALAHIHGGDRAEGVADEAMRHAISKLACLHLVASEGSAARLSRMGEPADRIVVVGSPAMCGIGLVRALESVEVGGVLMRRPPRVIVLHHPSGLGDDVERGLARAVGEGVARSGVEGERVLWLSPNGDAGSAGVRDEIGAVADRSGWVVGEHVPRGVFLGLLAGLARDGGALVGNSSAGLIEAAALGVGVVNCGPRQRGRERAGNVVDVRDHAADVAWEEVAAAIGVARGMSGRRFDHPYGEGDADERIAAAVAALGRLGEWSIRKRCVY